MKLWELRSYDQVIKLEQERLVYQARLRSRFGRAWRRKAPVESLMPLRLARYGVPLAETAAAGLAAAGIEPVLMPPPPRAVALTAGESAHAVPAGVVRQPEPAGGRGVEQQAQAPGPEESPWFQAPQQVDYHGGYDPMFEPEPSYGPEPPYDEWYEGQYEERYEERQPEQPGQPERPGPAADGSGRPVAQEPQPSGEDTGSFPIPVGPNRTRELGGGAGGPLPTPGEEEYYQVFRQSINGSLPTPREFADGVAATYGISLPDPEAKRMVTRFSNRFNAELEEDHIA
jgi:hypothetical protein